MGGGGKKGFLHVERVVSAGERAQSLAEGDLVSSWSSAFNNLNNILCFSAFK